MLETELRQTAKAREAAAGGSGARFGAVAADVAELRTAITSLRSESRRLESGLEGELGARRAAWETLTQQVGHLREALAASGESSERQMAGMLAPVDSKLSANVSEVGRSLQGERLAREAGEETGRDERAAMAELVALRLADLQQQISSLGARDKRDVEAERKRATVELAGVRRALQDEEE